MCVCVVCVFFVCVFVCFVDRHVIYFSFYSTYFLIGIFYNKLMNEFSLQKHLLAIKPHSCFCLTAKETSALFHIHSWVPKKILGPLLYALYTLLFPSSRETAISTFASDTAIFAIHEESIFTSLNFQEHFQVIKKTLKKWKINFIESNSEHINVN